MYRCISSAVQLCFCVCPSMSFCTVGQCAAAFRVSLCMLVCFFHSIWKLNQKDEAVIVYRACRCSCFLHPSSFISLLLKYLSPFFFHSLDPFLVPLAVNKEIIIIQKHTTGRKTVVFLPVVCFCMCASRPQALPSNRLQITRLPIINRCTRKVFKYYQ